jgi:hypothetical protein
MSDLTELARSDMIAPAPSVHTELFTDGEFAAVVFDERNRVVYRLNDMSSAVWCFCDGQTTFDSITAELISLGLNAEIASATVEDALRSFGELGLLEGSEVVSEPVTEATSEGLRVLPREPDP